MPKQTCEHCQEILPTHMDLRLHVLKFHPAKINELAPLPRYQKNLVCETCSQKFRSNESLKHHVRDAHPTKDKQIESTVDSKEKTQSQEKKVCPLCDFQCSYKYTYRKHVKEKHPEKATTLAPTLRIPKHEKKCPLCSYCNTSKKDITDHFTNDHRIKLQTKSFNFANLSLFYEWKNMMERDTTCKYTQNSKAVTESGKRTSYRFVCHRSGFYRNASKGVRKVKYKGTNKINGYCPSELVVISDESGCLVHYVKTHIGHSNEIQRVTLTREERDALAVKIANGVPFDKILEEARLSKNGTSVERLQLLTRKDLFNISKRYSLQQSAVLWDHRDVDTWVEETEGILFYKPEHKQCPENPALMKSDFVLIIMNICQKEIFAGFCDDLVCVDSLTGVNDNFELITLMVRDNALNGFPCAFMFTNRIDQTVMELFFSCIKEKVDHIQVKALMTDFNDLHCNAWEKVFGAPKRRLYCSWHVDRAWRTHLNRVKPTEERRLAYTLLKNIQTESIEHKFKKLLDEFLNNETIDSELRTNFAENFVPCCPKWASFYRIEDSINEDSQMQQLHEHLKYICTYGKKQKPLDMILTAVMRMVGDNLVNRKVILNSDETVYHLNLIQKRHRDSYLGSFDSIIAVDEGWHVSSFVELNEPYELFFVQQVLEKCNCNYTCSECHTCIHQFACSCVDNSVENNMCKHIHLVIRFRDGKKHFILDEGNGTFKDIESESDQADDRIEYCTDVDECAPFQAQHEEHQFQNDANFNSITDDRTDFDNFDKENKLQISSSDHRTANQHQLIVDNNDFKISMIPVLSPEEQLQKRKLQLIEAVTKQIEKVRSFQQIQVLENMFAQADDRMNEFRTNVI